MFVEITALPSDFRLQDNEAENTGRRKTMVLHEFTHHKSQALRKNHKIVNLNEAVYLLEENLPLSSRAWRGPPGEYYNRLSNHREFKLNDPPIYIFL